MPKYLHHCAYIIYVLFSLQFESLSHQVQVPANPHAREKYLKRQRDRLLENKKAQTDTFSASPSTTHTKGSKWQSATTDSYIKQADKRESEERPQKGKEETGQKGAREESSGGSEKCGLRVKSKTGVLCTVIARQLEKEEMFL